MFPNGFGGGFGGGPDPFAHMQQQMDRMMRDMTSGMFSQHPDPFFSGSQQVQPQQRSDHGRSRQEHAPSVQELHDYDAHQGDGSQPTVEEPDDIDHSRCRPQRRQADQQMQPFGGMGMGGDPFAGLFGQQMMPFGGMGNFGSGATYSYSSSYSSSSGPNGVVYESSNTMRRGPDGVMESHSTERDGRTGQERMRITRGLKDRQRTLERSRRNGGQEERHEALQGMSTAEEARAFDEEWQSAAARGLPHGGMFGRHGDGTTNPAYRQLGYGDQGRKV